MALTEDKIVEELKELNGCVYSGHRVYMNYFNEREISIVVKNRDGFTEGGVDIPYKLLFRYSKFVKQNVYVACYLFVIQTTIRGKLKDNAYDYILSFLFIKN